MTDLGIEYQTVMGLPPIEFVHLAADLGCSRISMKARGGGGPYNPWGFPEYSFVDDAALRRRMCAAMDARGVSISLGEGFVVLPGRDLLQDRANLDVMEEFGVRRVNAVTMDPDLARSVDQIGALAEAAAERGMETTMEFARSLAVSELAEAMWIVAEVARPDFRLLIDTMHVARSGVTPEELGALDPSLIGYVQLCDATVRQNHAVYRDDSSDRLVPGEGELPLPELLAAMPAGLPVGVEVPMRSRAEAGASPQACAAEAVEGARRVLAQAAVRRGVDAARGLLARDSRHSAE
ncbi:MAG: TIM barrel protein [Nocardioides sp.]|uniref:sugar phosphate isomerase/epimerase family protein n=1 Tax=Nocardioides sp. TaxID=35761 RepID=UPI0039E406B8